MKRRRLQGLFEAIDCTRGNENYLSRLFAACFERSPAFAQAVLDELWSACRQRRPTPDAARYRIACQVAAPVAGGGIVDMCLSPTETKGRRLPVLWLESKRGAKLMLPQLEKYRAHGIDVLVAVTKNWPEVSRQDLARHGVATLRWQDFAGALRRAAMPRAPVERYLMMEFLGYLEGSEMAYHEALKVSELDSLRRTLNVVGGLKKREGVVPRRAFAFADDCTSLMSDVYRHLVERRPAVADLACWGPGYFAWRLDHAVTHHCFGFQLYHRGNGRRSSVLVALFLPVALDEPSTFCVLHDGSKASGEHCVERRITDGPGRGYLDAEQMSRVADQAMAKWRRFPLRRRSSAAMTARDSL
jgi:hypothetical protein